MLVVIWFWKMFTQNEKVDMLSVYRESQTNLWRALQSYAQRYPERVISSFKIFASLERNSSRNNEEFSIRTGKKIVKNVNSDDTVTNVLQNFEDHPRKSIRQACHEMHLKYSSVRIILKKMVITIINFSIYIVHLSDKSTSTTGN